LRSFVLLPTFLPYSQSFIPIGRHPPANLPLLLKINLSWTEPTLLQLLLQSTWVRSFLIRIWKNDTRYPDRPRTLRDILRYEEETIQSLKGPIPLFHVENNLNAKWEEGTPNAGRVRCLQICPERYPNYSLNPVDIEPWDVPDDVAVFDTMMSFLVHNNSRSFPDSIRYLISLDTIRTVHPHQYFTVPNDSMTTLTNVKELNIYVDCGRNKVFRFNLAVACKVNGMGHLISLTRLIGENIDLDFSYMRSDPLRIYECFFS